MTKATITIELELDDKTTPAWVKFLPFLHDLSFDPNGPVATMRVEYDRPTQHLVVEGDAISRAGQPWDEDEKKRLLLRFRSGTSIRELASVHRRSKGAITSRLAHLGEIHPRTGDTLCPKK